MSRDKPFSGLTLVQVYQTRYNDGAAKGLGDFLRGYGCLIQLGEALGFSVHVDLRNHPLSRHVAEPSTTADHVDYSVTTVCPHINYVAAPGWVVEPDSEFKTKFVEWLQSALSRSDYNVVPVFVTAYPLHPLTQLEKERVRRCVQPSPATLARFEASSPARPYSVLHFRTGDSIVVHKNSVRPTLVSRMCEVAKTMNIGDVFLADTRELDETVMEEHGLIVTGSRPLHLSDSPQKDLLESCDQTLYDWWVLSRASRIVAVSVYYWGSGFSSQASLLYNTPLTKYVIWEPSGYTLHVAPHSA